MSKMVNDTTTLNGALMELGDTMASNLNTKGVQTSSSDGLTTLANKILDIEQGSDIAILFSDKQALSFVDNDICTLFAVFYEEGDPAINKNVTLYKMTGDSPDPNNDVVYGSMTQIKNGVYKIEYNSVADKDISFYASYDSVLTNICLVEDCIKANFKNIVFDNRNGSRTLHEMENTGNSLSVTTKPSGGSFSNVFLGEISTPDDWECSFNVKYNSLSAMRFGIQSDNVLAADIEAGNVSYETTDYYGPAATFIGFNKNMTGNITKTNRTNRTLPTDILSIKIIRKSSDTVEIYENNIKKQTVNGFIWLSDPLRIFVHSYGTSGNVVYSDFKFKGTIQ